MATPTVTSQKISQYVKSDLEKMLATLPQQGSEVSFDPVALDKVFAPAAPDEPIAPVITDTQPMVRKDDIVLTPPISKDVIITPPAMAEKSSLLLPILVAGAILLMQ